MRVNNPPFSTRHWQSLWKSHISSLDDLREKSLRHGIVAVDIEPWSEDEQQASEIAFSFLPHGSHIPPPAMIKTLSTILKTRTIVISGRESHAAQDPQKRESLDFGDVRTVNADEVEDAILETLESFWRTSTPGSVESSPRPILTGFDLSREFKTISALYPRVLQHFSAWTDMQEQALAASTRAGETTSPGMQECLRALGFGDRNDYWAITRRAHRAANDTVRIMAIFLHLIGRPADSPPLLIQSALRKWRPNKARQAHMKGDNIFAYRPRPANKYPFLVKLALEDALIEFSGPTLLNHFADYSPTAVGLESYRRKRHHGWLCLPNLSTLNRFVHDVKGAECQGKAWQVEVHITPGFEHMQDEEWDQLQQAREMEERANAAHEVERKRLLRKENERTRLLGRDEEMTENATLFADLGAMSLFDEDTNEC